MLLYDTCCGIWIQTRYNCFNFTVAFCCTLELCCILYLYRWILWLFDYLELYQIKPRNSIKFFFDSLHSPYVRTYMLSIQICRKKQYYAVILLRNIIKLAPEKNIYGTKKSILWATEIIEWAHRQNYPSSKLHKIYTNEIIIILIMTLETINYFCIFLRRNIFLINDWNFTSHSQ